MLNISLFLISNFFNRNNFVFVFSSKYSSLSTRSEPLKIIDCFKHYFPFIIWNWEKNTINESIKWGYIQFLGLFQQLQLVISQNTNTPPYHLILYTCYLLIKNCKILADEARFFFWVGGGQFVRFASKIHSKKYLI